MSIPAPLRFIEYLIPKTAYPVTVIGMTLFALLSIFFIAFGALRPIIEPELWVNPMELVGLYLMLSIMPTCLLMWLVSWLRLSGLVFSEIQDQMEANLQINVERYRYAGYWPLAVMTGVAFAILANTDMSSLDPNLGSPYFLINVSLVCGQILVWAMVAFLFYIVILDDMALFRCGRHVAVNIYNLDRVNGFGRAALSQFFMVIGALALTTLQSLDREFYWINYANGLYVGVPAAIVFILLPTWSIRRNIKSAKAQALDEINAEIESASTGLDSSSLSRMNDLIARRNQVQHTRTWPMDTSIFSRFLFYIFIPPLAWLGAALVEIMLDSFLAG